MQNFSFFLPKEFLYLRDTIRDFCRTNTCMKAYNRKEINRSTNFYEAHGTQCSSIITEIVQKCQRNMDIT